MQQSQTLWTTERIVYTVVWTNEVINKQTIKPPYAEYKVYFTSIKGARNAYLLGSFGPFLLTEFSLCRVTGCWFFAGQRTAFNGGTRWRRLKGEGD